MPWINVDTENSGDIDLYYEDHGEGKPVVLIHGWPLSGRSWERQVSVLLEAGYRVITYDRRGFGESSRPTTGYDYDTFAGDLDLIMTELELCDAALVGFSMGTGEVARYLSIYGSDRVERAAFIASVPPYLLKAQDNPTGVEGEVFDEIRSAIVMDRPAYLTKFFNDFYNVDVLGGDRVSEEAVRFSWYIAVGASPVGTLECVTAWATDFRNDLQQVQMPTLIIHGDADRVLPIAATGIPLHETLEGSRFVVIEGGPHGVIWTHAERVNHELLEFLGESATSTETPATGPA